MKAEPSTFQERRCVLALIDCTGFTRLTERLDALGVARFLEDLYAVIAGGVTAAGGRVVKCMGDGVLSVFPEELAAQAVAAVAALAGPVRDCGARHGADIRLGANLHRATVAEGPLGPDGAQLCDVVGVGVNATFLLGGGAGVRISEPVYRALPNAQRGDWRKHKPPAIYRLET